MKGMREQGLVLVETVLMHKSGQWMSCVTSTPIKGKIDRRPSAPLQPIVAVTPPPPSFGDRTGS